MSTFEIHIKYTDSGSIDIDKTLSAAKDQLIKRQMLENTSRVEVSELINRVFTESANGRFISKDSVCKIALMNNWLSVTIDNIMAYEANVQFMLTANSSKNPKECESGEKEFFVRTGKNGGIARWKDLPQESKEKFLTKTNKQ